MPFTVVSGGKLSRQSVAVFGRPDNQRVMATSLAAAARVERSCLRIDANQTGLSRTRERR